MRSRREGPAVRRRREGSGRGGGGPSALGAIGKGFGIALMAIALAAVVAIGAVFLFLRPAPIEFATERPFEATAVGYSSSTRSQGSCEITVYSIDDDVSAALVGGVYGGFTAPHRLDPEVWRRSEWAPAAEIRLDAIPWSHSVCSESRAQELRQALLSDGAQVAFLLSLDRGRAAVVAVAPAAQTLIVARFTRSEDVLGRGGARRIDGRDI